MKKLIIVSLLFLSLLSAPIFVHAQTAPTQEELTQQLITLLTELISQLQQQIASILAAQSAQQDTLNQIAQNTTPAQTGIASGTGENQPVIQAPQPLSVTCSGVVNSLDDPNFQITFTANPSGGDGGYKYLWQGVSNQFTGCSFHGDGKTIWGEILDSGCSMPDSSTAVLNHPDYTTPNSYSTDSNGVRTSIFTPPTTLNQLAQQQSQMTVDIDGNPIFSIQDKLNHLVLLWVRDGSQTVHSYCPITVSQ